MERGLPADHTTIWRRVQRCRRIEHEVPAGVKTNQRLLEGQRNVHLPRREMAVPVWCRRFSQAPRSTFGFPLGVTRLRPSSSSRKLAAPGHPRPRVITVAGNPSYPNVIAELKQERKLGRRCRCRTCPYFNNVVEQDHRAIKSNGGSMPATGFDRSPERGERFKATRSCT
jgi:IS6 family transposase